MNSDTYFLLDEEERAVVVHGESGLRVHVFSLELEDFRPTKGELHIYGDDHGEWLAFETEGWTTENLDIMKGAVVWYARYLDYPEMDMTTEDPRPANKLRLT